MFGKDKDASFRVPEEYFQHGNWLFRQV